MSTGGSTWYLVDSGSRHPHENMAVDEAHLGLPRGHPVVLRFYDWSPPGLSLGYFQEAEEPPADQAERLGAVLTRRATGGGAILHQGDITYSIAGDEGSPPFAGTVEESYFAVHGAIAAGLARLGIAAAPRGKSPLTEPAADPAGRCFCAVTSFDLVAAGGKLVGSAQRRKRGRVLHHGTILLDPNPLAPEAACLRSLSRPDLTRSEILAAIVAGFEAFFDVRLRPWLPGPGTAMAAARIIREKYGNPAWLRLRVEGSSAGPAASRPAPRPAG